MKAILWPMLGLFLLISAVNCANTKAVLKETARKLPPEETIIQELRLGAWEDADFFYAAGIGFLKKAENAWNIADKYAKMNMIFYVGDQGVIVSDWLCATIFNLEATYYCIEGNNRGGAEICKVYILIRLPKAITRQRGYAKYGG